MPSTAPNPALHRIAWLTAIAVFPLICIGSAVTTKGAGMSVPDWPNSYGYNMVLFPPSQWYGGILYEHTHRLMGMVVGFLAVVLTLAAWGPAARPVARRRLAIATIIALFATFFVALTLLVVNVTQRQTDFNRGHLPPEIAGRLSHAAVGLGGVTSVLLVAWLCRRREPRRAVRWVCTAVLLAVLFQGLLGGLRVVLVEVNLAVVHACVAQAFFCLCAIAVLMTGRWWSPADQNTDRDIATASLAQAVPSGVSLTRLAVLGAAVVYLQLIVGATMRHYDAGLAIPDVPLNYGKLLPPASQAGLDAANLQRAMSGDATLHPVTLEQIWLHAGHRIGAVLVTVVLSWLIYRALRVSAVREASRGPALVLLPLLLVQLTLGILTVLWRKPFEIASLHVAVGALVLVTTVVLAARAWRQFGISRVATNREIRHSFSPASPRPV